MSERRVNLTVWRRLNEGQDWKEVCKELDDLIASELQALRRCGEAAEMYRIQARIEALDTLKQLPDSVLDREEA